MDYSSYTQPTPQDPNQYQQQQQENQYQQQQTYDPSQIQAYDQSYQAYNAYYQQYDPNNQYSYYQSQDYANSYSQQTQPQIQQEPTSIYPPGVPIPPESSSRASQEKTHLQNQQNAYYSQGGVENQQQSDPNLAPPGGLNPAAAAAVEALSQLTHFAGSMDAAQRAARPLIGQTPYRGGGRRGGRPFRGGGRGHFGHRAPSFRGKGRGRGGSGRHFSLDGAPPNTTAESAPSDGSSAVLTETPSASFPGQTPPPVPGQVPAAPFRPLPRMAWCELCRVDCNTPEILEQHKNGKRHKKNLKTHEELQRLNKVISGQQNDNAQMPNSELMKPEVNESEKVEGLHETQPENKNLTSEAVVADDNRNETEQRKDTVDNSELSAQESERKPGDQFAGQGRGSKRKIRGGRGGRGGKYARTYEGSRRPVEPPKPPKQVIPFICELCNVKCESQVVFDTHLIGKKHTSNLKRFHGHRALYGEAGLQALYPPNVNDASSSAIPQVPQGVPQGFPQGVPQGFPQGFPQGIPQGFPQGFPQGVSNDPQVILAQLLMNYVLSQAQVQAQGQVPGIPQLSAPAPALNLVTDYHQQDGESVKPQAVSEGGTQNPLVGEVKSDLKSTPVVGEVKSELLSAPLQSEVPLVASAEIGTSSGTSSQVKAKEETHSSNNAVIESSKINSECEVTLSDKVVQEVGDSKTE